MFKRELLITTATLVFLWSIGSALARSAQISDGLPPSQVTRQPAAVSKPPPVEPVVVAPPVVKPAPRKKVKTSPPPARKKATPVVVTRQPSWNATPDTNGLLMLSNGQGVSLTSRENGAPLLIVSLETPAPMGSVGGVTPVNFIIDGASLMLPASVSDHGLYVDDPRIIELEYRLLKGRSLKVVSAFAVFDVSLIGLRNDFTLLSEARRRLAMKPATTVSTTVVEVNVNSGKQSSEAPPVSAATPEASAGADQPAVPTAPETKVPAQNTPNVAVTLSQLSDETQLSITRANEMNKRVADLAAQIETLTKVLQEQQTLHDTTTIADDKPAIEQTILAINIRIETLKKEYRDKETVFNQYLTSIKPNDRDLYITARKASQLYPKIPYYIPGTSETGEFWVEPKVSDEGQLTFIFRFMDPESVSETTRGLINMNPAELEQTQQALAKLYKNSKIAHEKRIRENYSNRVVCFPTAECPPVRQKGKPGQTSTEVLFVIYEDGSTAGRLQHNKGSYQEGVNFSIDSALLLQAYLAYVLKEAKLDFDSGTRTPDQLDKIFQ